MAEPRLKIDGPSGRLCCHCKLVKPLTEYTRDKDGPLGFYRACKECAAKYSKEYYRKNRNKVCERTKKWHVKTRSDPEQRKKEWSNLLKLKYDIDAEVYTRMCKEQNGRCAMCRRPEKVKLRGKIKRLCVDHDHRTGKVRKLLCDRCNRLIGVADDNTELLIKAIQYLKEN